MDILEQAAAGEGAVADVSGGRKYIDLKSPQEFTAEVSVAALLKHDNDENQYNGQPFIAFGMKLIDITEANLTTRSGDKYVPVEAREGDEVSKVIELASAGIKASVQKMNLREAAALASMLANNGTRQEDYFSGASPGPLGIKAVLSDPEAHVGKKVRVYTNEKPNAKGYYYLTMELVEEAAPAKKGKKGKAA